MHRRDPGAAALLDPHNEHIVLFPVAIQELLLRIFGMDSMMPESVVLTALLLATATLVFLYARRRVGPWLALVAAVLLLFLGPAWQDLLWPFQIGFAGSAAFGVASLLALESEGRRADLLACVCLVLAIGFSSLGLPFAGAALLDVFQRRRRRGWGRLWVPAIPLALYAVWYLGWGHTAENSVTAHNILVSPGYLVEGLAASLDALLALATILGEAVGRSDWGLPLLIVLVLGVAYALYRGHRPDTRIWPVLAATATFWLLAGANTIPGREAWSSRYLYVGALFMLLIAANLLRGVRLRPWALALVSALAFLVVGFNLEPLREGHDFFRKQTVLTRADLAAIEIAAGSVEPGFALPPEISGTPFLNEISAGEYLQAVDEFGPPAYSAAELARAPEEGRSQADVVLANALPLAIEPGAPAKPASGRCVRLPATSEPNATAPLALRSGTTTVELAPGAAGAIRLRRFAVHEYPLSAEGLAAGSTTRIYVPRDRSRRPWLLAVSAPGGATVCGAVASAAP
jgi:hypothetical protein